MIKIFTNIGKSLKRNASLLCNKKIFFIINMESFTLRNALGRGWGQRFVTKPYRKIEICTVFCYEGGGGFENPGNRVTYYVDFYVFESHWKNLSWLP